MKTMLKAVSVAAGVSMAAFALAGVAAPAQAEEMRIQTSDLNLRTPEGTARFDARVDRAAKQMCSDYRGLNENAQCVRAVREEANENLKQQQEQLARQGGMDVASARR